MIVDEITSNNERNNEFTSEFVQMLTKFSTSNSSTITNIQAIIEKVCTTSITSTTEFVSILLAKLHELEAQEVDHEKLLNGKLQKLQEAITDQQQHQIDHNKTIISLTVDNKRHENLFFDQLTVNLNALANEIVENNYDSNILRLNGTVANSTQMVNEQLAGLTRLEQLIAEMKIQTLSIQTNNTELVGLSLTMAGERNDIKSSFEGKINEIRKFQLESQQNEQIEQTVCQNIAKLTEVRDDFARNIDDSRRMTVNHVTASHLKHADIRSVSESHSCATDKYLTDAMQRLSVENGALATAVITQNNNSLDVLSTENKRSQRSHLMSKSYHESLSGCQTESDRIVKTKLKTITDEVETFRTHEVQTYANTGMTPLKKSYRIQKQLVSTSPHDRLLQRYREEYDDSDEFNVSLTISEQPSLCESFTADMSNMNILMSSSVRSDEATDCLETTRGIDTANDNTIENSTSSESWVTGVVMPNDSIGVVAGDVSVSSIVLHNANVNYDNRYLESGSLLKGRVENNPVEVINIFSMIFLLYKYFY